MTKSISYHDAKESGFEEVIRPKKPKPPSKTVTQPVAKTPYIVVDNAEIVSEMVTANRLFKAAIVQVAQETKRPKSMKMAIKRNASGFMDSVEVSFKY